MEPVAIVGMACVFPGARDMRQYWQNIVDGVDSISQVPETRWPGEFYDPASTEIDRFYCRRGGFIDDFVDFDPIRFGVMPKPAASSDPDQLIGLRIGADALRDAGYEDGAFPRERTGVVIGKGGYLSAGTLRLDQHVRMVQQVVQVVGDLFPDITPAELAAVRKQLRSKLDYYGPDVAVGTIPNLAASRLANRLDLGGAAYTVDAACASSLIAVEHACRSLSRHESDMMLAGGIHVSHDLTFWATFCQLGALSRAEKIRPLSNSADGILAGEGAGMLVLKRLGDAERDGDRIYAVIAGIASASDGRATSLLAPSVTGQLRALERAWQLSELPRSLLGLLEAHGTGTPAGDRAELETVRAFFGASEEEKSRAVIGSVKSMIGHTMPAAGMAGLIKAALSVHHGILPPTLHCDDPHPLLEETRFKTISKSVAWNCARSDRVAAVNAFGFGGINAHAVLRGIRENQPAQLSFGATATPQLPVAHTIASEDRSELLVKLKKRQWDRGPGVGKWRLAVFDPNEKRLALAEKVVEAGQSWHGRNDIYFSGDGLGAAPGNIAFLFPGVDSRFEPQVADIASCFSIPISNQCIACDPADNILQVILGISELNAVMRDVLAKLNVTPGALAGHSVGEWSAMVAAGVLPPYLETRPQIPEVRNKDVLYLAAACDAAVAATMIADLGGIAISHDNCPHQVIFCGKIGAVDILSPRLRNAGILHQRLPFVSGFHSPLFAEHIDYYRDYYDEADFSAPKIPLWSATTGKQFPAEVTAMRRLAVEHLLQPVNFRRLIENMYEDGFRIFIQAGTGSLVGFVEDILKGRPHFAISANVPKRTGMQQLCHLVAGLWVQQASVDTSLLFGGEVLAGKEFQAASTANVSSNGAASIRLRLGVPLIRLDTPLPGHRPGSAPLTNGGAQLSPTPVNNAYADMMQVLEQARNEVMQAMACVGVPAADLKVEPAQRVPIANFQAISEPSSMPDKSIVKILDVHSGVPELLDHALYLEREDWPVLADLRSIVPLTMEVSILRQEIEREFPEYIVVEIEKIEAFKWLVVADVVKINIVLSWQSRFAIQASIEGFMNATAILAPRYPRSIAPSDNTLRNPRASSVSAEQLYADKWMFHGPAYQGVTEIGSIADNGIEGRIVVPTGQGSLLDNMGQFAGFWVMETAEVNPLAMPIGVDKILFYTKEPSVGEKFECRVWIREFDDDHCQSDIELIDADGRVAVAIKGWTTRRYKMDRDFWMRVKEVHLRPVCDAIGPGVMIFNDRYDTAIVRDYIARRFLNQPELAEYEQCSPRGKRAWLNGRIAAKDAARRYLWEQGGPAAIFPKELRIANDAAGMPTVTSYLSEVAPVPPHISISHKDLIAVAIASNRPVGIDIERIAAHSDVLMDTSLCDSEKQLLSKQNRDEWFTRFWVAKEARGKVQGTGLMGSPKQFVVEKIDRDRLLVNGVWIQTVLHDAYIIGWSLDA